MKKINTKLTIIIILVIACLVCLLILLNSMGLISFKKKYTTYIDIDYTELMEKIDNKEDFILFIYQTGCSHC